jgi:hypothetical protein
MTGMRPDPHSDLAGEQSEYGDDTGFAADATRQPAAATREPAAATGDADADPTGEPDADRDRTESAGLTVEDDHIGDGAD